MKINPEKLEINSYLYERGVNFLKDGRHRKTEPLLKAIERVAIWAWFHHPGRFADGALENLAFNVGLKLKNIENNSSIKFPFPKHDVNCTLHLATRLFGDGGHSRFLAKWIERDKSAKHVALLTDQRYAIPNLLEQIITKNGNFCICLPTNDSIENRAALVRKISQSFNRVILHTHPNDSIPVVAFAKEGGPPVAMFNHAHFSFNLGSTVADIIINSIEYFREISERFRFARSTALLPEGLSGLWSITMDTIDKRAAKRELSLPESATVIISIAQEHYFRPMKNYNFFHTVRSILKKLPDAYLMIVGVKKGSPIVPDDLSLNPRLLLMGYVQNPIVHYQASDICLESFPIPSLGAVTEAVAYGEAYPVPVYGPGENILRVQRSISTFRPSNEEAYVEYVVSLASRKEEIRAEARRMRAEMIENDQLLEDRLCALNSLIDGVKHSPRKIPVVKMIESDDCRTLAERDQSEIGDKIDALFPFIPSINHHFGAVLKGQQTFETAIKQIISRMKMGLSRRGVPFLGKSNLV